MNRNTLPNRRAGESVSFELGGIAYTATLNRYADGSPAELFLDGPKTGSTANIIAKECAVTLSLALQYGCPIERVREALPRLADGEPAGPLGTALKEAMA